MKKIVVLVVALVFAFSVFLYFSRNWLAQHTFQWAVTRLTGFKTAVSQFQIDFSKGTVQVRELTIYNPKGFQRPVFAYVPELFLSADFWALLAGKVRIREARINLAEMNIEKKAEDVSNIQLLSGTGKKPIQQEVLKRQPPPKQPKKPGSFFYLDRLELTVRHLSYHDYSGIIPKKVDADLKIEKEVFEGIQDPKSIVYIILVRVFRSGVLVNMPAAALENLGLDPVQIETLLTQTVAQGREFLQRSSTQLAERAEVTLKETLGVPKVFLDRAERSAGDALEGLLGAVETQLASAKPSSERNQ